MLIRTTLTWEALGEEQYASHKCGKLRLQGLRANRNQNRTLIWMPTIGFRLGCPSWEGTQRGVSDTVNVVVGLCAQTMDTETANLFCILILSENLNYNQASKLQRRSTERSVKKQRYQKEQMLMFFMPVLDSEGSKGCLIIMWKWDLSEISESTCLAWSLETH